MGVLARCPCPCARCDSLCGAWRGFLVSSWWWRGPWRWRRWGCDWRRGEEAAGAPGLLAVGTGGGGPSGSGLAPLARAPHNPRISFCLLLPASDPGRARARCGGGTGRHAWSVPSPPPCGVAAAHTARTYLTAQMDPEGGRSETRKHRCAAVGCHVSHPKLLAAVRGAEDESAPPIVGSPVWATHEAAAAVPLSGAAGF